MRILITGAAGFIGSHLADRLEAVGHEVTGVDNLLTGRAENWQAEGFFTGDIVDRAGFYDLANLARPEVIIHCAASYDNRDLWHRDTDTNVAGAINVAAVAKHHGARAIYFQTALCYGNDPYDVRTPHERTAARLAAIIAGAALDSGLVPFPLSTNVPLAPESSYAISKVAAEQYLRLSEVPLTVFRLANIYGPRNLSGPVPTFYKRLTEGQSVTVVDSRRDFVYIDDLVNLVVQAISNQTTGTFHVSTGSDYPISQLYEAVCGALDRYDAFPADITTRGEDDAPTILLDPSATKAMFGWEATTDLDEGVEKAVEWYREHGVDKTFTHLALKG